MVRDPGHSMLVIGTVFILTMVHLVAKCGDVAPAADDSPDDLTRVRVCPVAMGRESIITSAALGRRGPPPS